MVLQTSQSITLGMFVVFFFQPKCEIVAWVQHALREYSMSDAVKVVFRRYANKIADKLNKKLLERRRINGNKFACVVPCSRRGTYRKTSNNRPHSNWQVNHSPSIFLCIGSLWKGVKTIIYSIKDKYCDIFTLTEATSVPFSMDTNNGKYKQNSFIQGAKIVDETLYHIVSILF